MAKKPPRKGGSARGSGYVTVYRHYRTGKLMRAKDYGYKAWPFGPRAK